MAINDNDRHRLVWSQGHQNLGRSKTVRGSWGRLRSILTDVFVDKAYTIQKYQALEDVEEKTRRKNLNGFFLGGPTANGHRSNNGIECRTLITLDVDEMTADQYEDWRERKAGRLWQWEFVAVETRSSTDHKPRFRLVFPIIGRLTFDEYNAVSRILASLLFDDEEESMRAVDDVSFRFAQLMFLPTASKNQKLEVFDNKGKLLNPKKLLKIWSKKHGLDWTNHANLPFNPDRGNKAPTAPGTTVEDPFEKDGIIGAFCRAYPVEEAIANFLPDKYEESASPSSLPRYSYTEGTGSNGAVVYEDGRFLYSNHGSDPTSEQLVNSWDLVRIHMFAAKDKDARANTSQMNLPSSMAMKKLAEADAAVQAERAAAVAPKFDEVDFEDDEDDEDEPSRQNDRSKPSDDTLRHIDSEIDDLLGDKEEADEEPDTTSKFDDIEDEEDQEVRKSKKPAKKKDKKGRDWIELLSFDKQGAIEKNRHNAATIISKDPRIARAIAKNDLTGTPYAVKLLNFKHLDIEQSPIPAKGRKWTDVDFSALAWALSAPTDPCQGWATDFTLEQIRTGLLQAAEGQTFNPVLEQIEPNEWDGVERVEEFFMKYCGVEDHPYFRETARAWFTAAIMRLYEPGCKFDFVPILEGQQEIGKSGLIEVLGLGFFGEMSDKFTDMQKMVESIRGCWILEVPELSGFNRHEVEDIKRWFSSRSDRIRLAYRENEEDFPRRCVFMGTGNKQEYLRDPTGNRRFWPIRVTVDAIDFDGPDGLKATLHQLWAEARSMYLDLRAKKPEGEIVLALRSPEARAKAKELQDGARDSGASDMLREAIEAWVDTPVHASVAQLHSPTAAKFVEEDDESESGPHYIRNLLSKTMLVEMCESKVIRANVRNDKLLGEALDRLGGWSKIGNVRRTVGGVSVRSRFYQRDLSTDDEWIPAPVGTDGTEDPEIDDLLG